MKLFKKDTILLSIVIVLAISSGINLFLYLKEKNKLENPSLIAHEEATRIKADVGKLILLYEEEEPTIVTITDVEQLKKENEEFYKYAQNGDKLILYKERAIIYRPPEKMIIKVAPVIGDTSQDNTQTPGEQQTPDGNE